MIQPCMWCACAHIATLATVGVMHLPQCFHHACGNHWYACAHMAALATVGAMHPSWYLSTTACLFWQPQYILNTFSLHLQSRDASQLVPVKPGVPVLATSLHFQYIRNPSNTPLPAGADEQSEKRPLFSLLCLSSI